MLTPFHLAINVTDLEATRVFYAKCWVRKRGAARRAGWILIFSAISFRST